MNRVIAFVIVCVFAVPSHTNAQWSKVLELASVNAITQSGHAILAAGFGGITITTNDGVSWTDVTGMLQGKLPYTARFTSNAVLVGTLDAGLYRSSREFTGWQEVHTGLNGARSIRAIVPKADTLLLVSENGLFRSTDEGLTWASLGDDVSTNSLWSVAITQDAILIGGYSGIASSVKPDSLWRIISDQQVVYDLDDELGRFLGSPTGALEIVNAQPVELPNIPNGKPILTATTSSGANVLVAGQGSIHISTDNGAQFFTSALPDITEYVLSAAFRGDSVYVGTSSGIYVSSLASVSDVEIDQVTRFGISLYPNPASSILHIRMDCAGPQEMEVTIVDLLGREVLRSHELLTDCEAGVAISTLPQGTYQCMIRQNANWETKLFTITR